MRYLIFLSVLCSSCSTPSTFFGDPRANLAPLSADTDRLLTEAEGHGDSALFLTGSGFALACLGFSPLAPLALTYAAIPLIVGGGIESGAAGALEDEARFRNNQEKTATSASIR